MSLRTFKHLAILVFTTLALVGFGTGVLVYAASRPQARTETAMVPVGVVEPAVPDVKEPADLIGMLRGRRILLTHHGKPDLKTDRPTSRRARARPERN